MMLATFTKPGRPGYHHIGKITVVCVFVPNVSKVSYVSIVPSVVEIEQIRINELNLELLLNIMYIIRLT